MRMMLSNVVGRAVLIVMTGMASMAWADALPPTDGRANLAAGKTVQFSPAPNYPLTRQGGTDATDLTDGEVMPPERHELWRHSEAVGWRYAGRVNLAVDLGQHSRIDEVAMRFVGGSPGGGGINIPGWFEVMVSDDGEHYRKVAAFSHFKEGAFEQFNVPSSEGRAWVHCLRFKDLDATGRWVGIRFYAPAYGASDELWVFGEEMEASGTSSQADQDQREAPEGSGFAIEHAQPHFHKPYLVLATNLPLPIPMGMTAAAEGGATDPVELTLDLPPGVELKGGSLGGTSVADIDRHDLPEGGRRVRFTIDRPSNNKVLGRLYVQAVDWSDGQTGRLTYRFSQGDWQSRTVAVPLRAVEVAPAPRLEHIMVGLGWWSARSSVNWPNVLETWRVLGVNSFAMFGHHLRNQDADAPPWQLLEQARAAGFHVTNIDSPYHRLEQRRENEPEIYCQFDDGTVSNQLCPSYRGEYFQEELERFARVTARVRPDYASQDIELLGGALRNSRRCTRCQSDFEASDLDSWEQWLQTKGDEMWIGLIRSARQALQEAGHEADFKTGGYNFRPGSAYDGVFALDQLYPEWMDSSQVSTYSYLFPYHLKFIGDEVRADRSQLPRNDVMPWITPGDAGTFPGDAFQWTLLECYTNGARGVWFWSGRVWDAESLIAYNRVVRAIGPVEQLIIEGDLVGEAAEVVGEGRVSGVRWNDQMLLLAADYFGAADGTVELRLDVPGRSILVDRLNNDAVVAELNAGSQTVAIDLQDKPARLLHLRPSQ